MGVTKVTLRNASPQFIQPSLRDSAINHCESSNSAWVPTIPKCHPTWGSMGYREHRFAGGGRSSRVRRYLGPTLIATFCFRNTESRHFIAINCASGLSDDLWSHPDLQEGADIIIEDGLHTFEANTSFLEGSLEHLRPGGFYVIEDICQDDAERWRTRFETAYSKRFPACEFALVTLPAHSGETYNNLLLIRRGVE